MIWKERTTGESSGSHGPTKKQAYYNDAKGIPTLEIRNQIANIRKRYGRDLAETPPVVVPHGPKKETSSPDSQTRRQTLPKRSRRKKIGSRFQSSTAAEHRQCSFFLG